MSNFNFRVAMRLFIAALVWAVFSTSTAYGQLSGSFTIDPSGSASSTNYKTIASAVSDLDFGTRADGGTANGPGISGAVTFKIANGTYNEQIKITSIKGVSASNTITFQSASGDSSKVILSYASSTSSTSNYTLMLDSADHIIFKQISIARTGTNAYAKVIDINNGADSNQFIGNFIKGQLKPSENPSPGIAVDEATIFSNTSSNDYNLFQGNRIKYGYNGISFSSTCTNNSILNNIIDTCGMSGAYMLNQTNLKITGNTFNMGTISISGKTHYLSYGVRLEYTANLNLTKNRFYSTSNAQVSRCITLFYGTLSSGGIGNIVANNFAWVSAGSSSSTGITLGGNSDLTVVYNNVLMTSTPTASAALYVYPQYTGSNNVIQNNNLINLGKGLAWDNSSTTNSTGVTTSDYNNLYTKGTVLVNYKGTTYSSLKGWTASGFDSNSVSADPGYVSNTDLHVSSSSVNNKGKAISGVTDDIDGETRSSTKPDIGADEFTPLALDAGVTSLDSPTVFCAGTSNIIVRITNFGTDTLKKATINWSVNGVTQTAYSWADTLAIGEISDPLKLGSLSLSANTPYAIKVWTSAPNGGTDGKGTNDTLRKTITSGLSGSYTIGGTSPDFKTFNDALDGITLRGLCGATVFNVRDGIYNEQLTIPNYPGTSSSKTITFQSQSADSTKVTLAHGSSNANGTNNATIQLNGARYIIFKDITITRTGTGTYMTLVELKAGASNNSFIENRLIGVKLSSSSAEANLINSTTDRDTSNIFRNNYFKYGNSAFNISGTSSAHEKGNVIENNIIDSVYTNGITATYNDGIIIRNNTIKNINVAGSSYYGISLTSSDGTIRVTRNKVMMPYGGTAGIYLTSSNGTSGSEGLIANNFVSLATGSTVTAPVGIYINSSPYQNVYFNSVNVFNTNTGSAFSTNASGNVNLKNNIFANNGGGQAIIAGSSSLASSNYNDLYTSGSKLGTFGSTAAADLAAWKTASSLDANSVSVKPYFLSNTSYITNNPALHGKGIALTAVTNDIENKTRSSKPSIGAFEAKLFMNEASITGVTSPSASICPGTNDVIVNLKNTGGDTLRSATINWLINGTAQTAYSFSGKIKPDSTASIKIGSNAFASGSTVIKVYSSKPNNGTDSFPYNDTVSVTIVASVPTANAGADQSICSGSSATIGSTAVTGMTYSWTSNPTGFTSTSANPSVSPTATTTYIVVAKNATGCTSTDTVKVTVNSLPTANAGSDQTICSGSSVSIGSTAVTGMTYSWTSNPTGFTSTSANPSVSPTATTTYIVAVKNTNGCIGTDTVKVTVNSLPTANAGSDQTLCSGGSATIGSTAVTGLTYSWTSNPTGFTSTSANPSVSPTATTTYTVSVKNANGCISTDDVTVTVGSLPTANAGSDQTICSGSSATIGSTAVTGMTYSWTSNPSGFTSTSANPSVSPTTTTTYTVEVKNASGCTKTDDVTVTVNSLPTANAGSDQTICDGESVQIGSTAVTGETYSWTSNPSGFTSTSADPTVNPTATTTYTVEVTNANGCKSTDEVTVTVNPLPTATAGADQSICEGDSVTIGATAVSGETYSWTSNPSGFTSTSSDPSVKPTATTTYTVEVTNANGCKSTDEVVITVNPLPTANAGADQTICSGASVTIGATAVTGETYSWTSNPSGFTSTSSNPSVSPTTTTTYTVVVTNANGCTSTDDVMVTVNPLPTANAGADQTICSGATVQIGSAGVTGETYSWTSTPSGFTSADAQPNVTPTATTTYTLVVTNANGCTSTDDVMVTVNPLPTANAGADQTICTGASTQIGATAVTGETYSWTSKNGFTSADANPTVTPTATDTYTVVVTNANGCTSTDEVTVIVNPLPTASAGTDQTICAGASVQIGTAGVTGNTYSWTSTNGYTSTDANPTITPTATATYTLVVTNASGCTSTDDVLVTVNQLPTTAGFAGTHGVGLEYTFTATDATQGTYTWDFGDGGSANTPTATHTYTAAGTYNVKLIVRNASGCEIMHDSTLVAEVNGIANNGNKTNFSLDVYPNPFNTTTTLAYSLALKANVSITLMDVTGKKVAQLVSGSQLSGNHTYTLNASDYNLKAGVYFINVNVDGVSTTRKIVRVQ